MAVDPLNSAQMLIAALDPNCKGSGQGMFSSEDAGSTWSRTCLPATPNNVSGQRPLLAYGSEGVVYTGNDRPEYNTGASDVLIFSSRDNGKTWSGPNKAFGFGNIYANRLEVDNSSISPFEKSIYIVGGSLNSGILVTHSSDGGITWKSAPLHEVHGFLVDYYPSLAIGADGTVYATWLLCKSNRYGCAGKLADIMLATSTDGGNNWSVPSIIANTRLAPDPVQYWPWGVLPGTSEVGISNIPVVAVDNSNGPNSGNVYVSFYNYNGTYVQVGVVTSKDHGQTWSEPVRVSACNIGDEFFHWISVAQDGTIGVTWLDTRKSSHVFYQPYSSVSTDGGATFTSEHQLSNRLSNPIKDPGTFFIGEYRTHIWVGNALYAGWMDNHKKNFELEIGGAQF